LGTNIAYQTVANGPLSAKFAPLAQTSSYATASKYTENMPWVVY